MPAAPTVSGSNFFDIDNISGHTAEIGTAATFKVALDASPAPPVPAAPDSNNHNKALDFDGSNDYVSLSNGSSLNFGSNQGFTVEAWVKTTDNAGAIVTFRNSTNGNPVIDLMVGYDGSTTNNGKVMALIRGNGGGLAEVDGGSDNDGY